MALINDVYEGLKKLFQKSNRGWISPDEFNSAANYAQTKIVRESFDYMDSVRNRQKIGRAGKIDYDKLKLAKETVRKLSSSATLTFDDPNFDYPSDYMLLENIYFGQRRVEEISPSERNILHNDFVSPSENYPVFLEHGDYIEIIPDTITSGVTMYYYKNFVTPKWTYVTTSSRPIFNQGASDFQDFIVPDLVYDELMVEMAKYLSLELKQPDIAQVMDKEDSKNEQLKREQ